jgi:phosphatidylserine decarboxylase
VTASQAQRKFFSKVLTKVSAGAYSLGANSANIIVQDRLTGQLQEEKMAVYVRIGIRVLYKGAKKGMQGDRGQLMCIKAFGHWLRF